MKSTTEINGHLITGVTAENESTVRAIIGTINGISPYNGEPTVDVGAAAKIIRERKLASWPASLPRSGAFFDAHTEITAIEACLSHYLSRISYALAEAKTSASILPSEAIAARELLRTLPAEKLEKHTLAFVGFATEYPSMGAVREFLESAADGAEVFLAESRSAGVSEEFDLSVEEIVEPLYSQARGRRLVAALTAKQPAKSL